MAVANHERIGNCLNLLQEGLREYVVRELSQKYPDDWMDKARQSLPPSGPDRLRDADGQ